MKKEIYSPPQIIYDGLITTRAGTPTGKDNTVIFNENEPTKQPAKQATKLVETISGEIRSVHDPVQQSKDDFWKAVDDNNYPVLREESRQAEVNSSTTNSSENLDMYGC